MTTETRERIKAYKRMLPDLRERVIAVALLLAMSASMLGSASFAWLTLSRNPEIRGMNSTVAANGNLEIALATGDGKDKPNESEVGDSSAAAGQTVKEANITWGNLVNLADASYGLENLTLRPAMLNSNALLNSPLSAADYTKDGRVQKLTTNFRYTSWIIPEDETETPYFGLAEGLGVRAVSSTTINANSFGGKVETMIQEVEGLNATARTKFEDITKNQDWMKSLASMMTIHMNASLNSEPQYTDAEVSETDLLNLLAMYTEFEAAFEAELGALTELVNLELYLAYGGDETKYVEKTKDDILTAIPNVKKDGTRDYIAATVTADNGTEKVVKITNLETFLYHYNMLRTDRQKLDQISKGDVYKWKTSGLKEVISQLVNIDQCKIQFGTDAAQTITEFTQQFNSAGKLELVSLATKYNNKQCKAIITNGILYEFEQRVGSKIQVKDTSKKDSGLELKAKVLASSINYEASATVYATIVTSATTPYTFAADLEHTEAMNTGAGVGVGDITAMDTYGLVIDLWARTNASNSYLMLEGNVLSQEKKQVAQGRDAEGNLVDIYVLERSETVADEEGNEQTYTDTYDLYKIESGSTVTWYRADTYVLFELQEGETPTKKMEVVYEVIGYEGENRVWTEEVSPLLTTDATTQGSGSCYVFYADSPQDQTQSLELLRAMRVAFINEEGKLLATARMDSDRAYEDSGRVTVPLTMDTEGVILGEDEDGNVIRAITPLVANVPLRITALVYLDGSIISNEHVLAASDIQGQLNIQFGSSANLMAINDTALEADIRRVSASIDNTHFDFDSYTGDMVTNVTLNVEGSEPTTITANFIRKINATQGSREDTMVFESRGNGVWTASYEFLTPGEYELRTVRLDGVDYDLSGELPAVTVEGFALDYILCQQGKNVQRKTASNSIPLDLSLKFRTNDPSKMPRTVIGYYVREVDGYQTNVIFTMNTNSQEWTGKANFLMSGEYTLKYLELDGEYYPLNEADYQMATVYLGMKVEVRTSSPSDPEILVFDSTTTPEDKNLKMRVKILDNGNNPMMGQDNVSITYQQRNGARTLSGDLTWNPRSGYYEGNMPAIYYGKFQFSKVSVAGDDISVATTAPSFTIKSPDPTRYAGFSKQTTVFAPNGDASLNIRLSNPIGATAEALITDQNGVEYTVITTSDSATELPDQAGVYQFGFRIPNNRNGSQDGTWTLQEVRVWDAFGDNGLEYTQAAPLVIDLRGQGNSVKVTHKVTPNFAANQGADFTGSFLQNHDINGITVTIADAAQSKVDVNGDGTADISNVKIVYSYKGDAKAKGGYTSNTIAAVDKFFTLKLEDAGDGKTFTQTTKQTVNIAGTYSPYSFSFDVYDGTKTTTKEYKGTDLNTLGIPSFTVTSTVPTVKIEAITSYSDPDGNASYKTDTTATVYFKKTISSGCTTTTSYDQPTVEIKLTGYGNASKATLTFKESNNGTVRLSTSNGGSHIDYFEWTSDNSNCKRWIGYYKNNSRDDDMTAAGTLTADTLIFTDTKGTQYFFKISDIITGVSAIVINNPG